jgi:hypothetical protein
MDAQTAASVVPVNVGLPHGLDRGCQFHRPLDQSMIEVLGIRR